MSFKNRDLNLETSRKASNILFFTTNTSHRSYPYCLIALTLFYLPFFSFFLPFILRLFLLLLLLLTTILPFPPNTTACTTTLNPPSPAHSCSLIFTLQICSPPPLPPDSPFSTGYIYHTSPPTSDLLLKESKLGGKALSVED